MAEETNATKVESGDLKPLVSGTSSNVTSATSSSAAGGTSTAKSSSQSMVSEKLSASGILCLNEVFCFWDHVFE